jgi:hypothetical protein
LHVLQLYDLVKRYRSRRELSLDAGLIGIGRSHAEQTLNFDKHVLCFNVEITQNAKFRIACSLDVCYIVVGNHLVEQVASFVKYVRLAMLGVLKTIDLVGVGVSVVSECALRDQKVHSCTTMHILYVLLAWRVNELVCTGPSIATQSRLVAYLVSLSSCALSKHIGCVGASGNGIANRAAGSTAFCLGGCRWCAASR